MTEFDDRIDDEADFLGKAFQRVIHVRRGPFIEKLSDLCEKKDREIASLEHELGKCQIFQKENDILKMQINHLEEDC